VNARLAFVPPSASWQVAAYVLNATDRRHSAFREDILTSAGVAIVWPARPREWGAEIEFQF
jgi:outer membrane receptor protein involved in Fe transport